MENKVETVINYFKEICKIPHGSKNEKALSDWICQLANESGLEVKQDDLWNVIVHKEASTGLESKDAIIFQAHLDMVCEKEASVIKDFEKDAIEITEYFEDGKRFFKANGTTLGADDGIGVAILLMFMFDKEIELPECYFIFTTQEEIGMYGARSIDLSEINAKYLINLDSENEEEVTVGCAGGVNLIFSKAEEQTNSNNQAYELVISGLKGGHSGVDIDKGRINANYLCAKILDMISNVQISSWIGGTKDNVICYNAKVVFSSDMFKEEIANKIDEVISKIQITEEDKDITVSLNVLTDEFQFYSTKASEDILKLLLNVKQGVIDMSAKMQNMVESSGNIGIVSIDDNKIVIRESMRSSVDEKKREYADYNKTLAKSHEFQCEEIGEYPGWDINTDSILQNMYCESYRNTHNGQEPKILSIHAGLECGLFAKNKPGLDMISIGPNLYDVHTPNERLDVESVVNLLKTLIDTIRKI